MVALNYWNFFVDDFTGTLPETIADECDESEIAAFNKALTAKKINFQL